MYANIITLMKNTKETAIMKVIRNSKGRFFGLYTKGGESINAQFVSESPYYVTVYDRNAKTKRKIAKKSLNYLSTQGKRVGALLD
jgi:hypothetical protein